MSQGGREGNLGKKKTIFNYYECSQIFIKIVNNTFLKTFVPDQTKCLIYMTFLAWSIIYAGEKDSTVLDPVFNDHLVVYIKHTPGVNLNGLKIYLV